LTPEEEIAALEAATRKAHEAIKDLRATMKEAKEFIDNEISQVFERQVTTQVEGLEKATKRAIDISTAKVFSRFDRIAALLLGDKTQEPLEDLAKRAMEAKHGHQRD
jgi:F0F1-type ATP synthase membrane subunit b/b'